MLNECENTSNELAVSVRGLSKRYSRSMGMGLQFFRRQKNSTDWFWALKNISFDVKRGTSLGIIGGNGAGKSTLLKILAKIIPPSKGQAEIWGRVNSLLEVGTGFQSDLSGRANIYLNASILGMTHSETSSVFNEIVEFSGIKDFIDMPVKYYSSGMYSRLAFSVAANVTGDILLVDEVLSVGDAEFRQKCLGRMNNLLSEEKRTVLFVSHSMEAVMRFCTHVLWLDHGEAIAFGHAEDVVSEYLRSVNRLMGKYKVDKGRQILGETENNGIAQSSLHDKQNIEKVEKKTNQVEIKAFSSEGASGFLPTARVLSVTLFNANGQEKEIVDREENLFVAINCEVIEETHAIHPVLHLRCGPRAGISEETHVFTSVKEPPLPKERGFYRVEVAIPNYLLATGRYVVSIALVTKAKPIIRHCKLERVLQFQVIEKIDKEADFLTEELHGVIHPSLVWRVRVLEPEEILS